MENELRAPNRNGTVGEKTNQNEAFNQLWWWLKDLGPPKTKKQVAYQSIIYTLQP